MKAKHVEETREELLKRAAEARTLRRRAKEETKATLMIQKSWRAYLELEKLRKVDQDNWDRRFANTKGSEIEAREQIRMIAQLLFIQEKKKKKKNRSAKHESFAMNVSRARVAVGLILQGISSRNPKVHLCALATDRSELPLFLHVFLRFISHCSTLAQAQRDPLLETGTLKLLTDLLNEENWACLQQEEGEIEMKKKKKKEQVQVAMAKLKDCLCSPFLFRLLHSVLMREEEIKEKYDASSVAPGPEKLAVSFCNKLLCTIVESREAGWIDLLLALFTIPKLHCQAKVTSEILMRESCFQKVVLAPITSKDFLDRFQNLGQNCKCFVITNLLHTICYAPCSKLDSHVIRCLIACLSSLTEDFSSAQDQQVDQMVQLENEVLRSLLTQHAIEKLLASNAFVHVMQLYLIVIKSFDKVKRVQGAEESAAPAPLVTTADSVLSFIAFSEIGVLKKLWFWLVDKLQIPREAPMEATRGWNIKSLQGGLIGKINETEMQMLSLFSKSYNHLLKVLDDTEFYSAQRPFTLAEQRAIAAVTNCIVFNSILYNGSGLSREENEVLCDVSRSNRSIFERDCKKSFCPPQLWLGPLQEGSPDAGMVASPALARQILSSSSSSAAQLLAQCPQCFPFLDRVTLFREVIEQDKAIGNWAKAPAFGGKMPSTFTIRRAYFLEDALREFTSIASKAKGRIEVKFVNEAGMMEAGLDYGGLLKEFLEVCAKKGFDPNLAIFKSTSEGLLHPSNLAEHMDQGLPLLFLLGMIVGKCLYDGILLEVRFASFFITHILGNMSPQLEDLRSYDLDLYNNVLNVKQYEGNAEDLGLYFAVEEDIFGKHVVNDLLPGGQEQPVTNNNKALYCHLVANFYLATSNGQAIRAFKTGLTQLINPAWLRMFSPREFNELISGGQLDIDVEDLKKHTKYAGGYDEKSPTIKIFWSVFGKLDPEERRAVVKFVTACSSPPILGFGKLNPPFCITKVKCETSVFASLGLGKDADRLPTASTCFNTLKLPNFKKASSLREKLLYAAQAQTGFELS